MSEKGSFTGGFFVGAIVGGIVGGVLGSLLASRPKTNTLDDDDILLESREDTPLKSNKNSKGVSRTLEEQINQLNLAIDDVRQHLKTGNNNGLDED